MKNTTNKHKEHKNITYSGQKQFQSQQGDKIHHTKHTITHRKGTLIVKTSVFTEQDNRCGNSINTVAIS